MNEHLKQIMLEHGLHKHISEDCQHRMEMLYELIVAECIDVFSKDLPEDTGKMLEVVNRVCNVAEHFGVEE